MTPFQWTVDQTKILQQCLCECEFARQLSLPRRHFGVNRLLFPSMFAGDNATIENNEEALERAGASSVSFGCWIHLRNHLGGWLCLTEPRTDCDRSCCLALQGQTFPHWCSKITDKKQLGGLEGGWNEHSAHSTLQSRSRGKGVGAYCVVLQSSPGSDSAPQCANHWFMLPTLIHKQTLSPCLNRHSDSSPCMSAFKMSLFIK